MKRAPKLVELSRREFCAFVGMAGGLGIAGCTVRDPSTTDAAPADGVPPTCATSAMDVGVPSRFVLGTPVFVASGLFFIVRDSGGIYAMTASCSHRGVTINATGQGFLCPMHGAIFDLDGGVVSGPAPSALHHYAMCMLANGNVGVSTEIIVPPATRLIA